MKRPARLHPVLEMLAIAALYYVAARLGLVLAFQKSNATPVWPSSGIALAMVMLLGRRALAGVFAGALAANVHVFLHNQMASMPTILVVSIVIAAGNTLEALVGSALLERMTGTRNPFERAQDAFKFVGVAFVMCLAGAAVGPPAVVVSGIVPSALFQTVWLTWWLGDTAGVLVFAPLLLSWIAARRTRWTPGKIGEALVVASLLFVAGRMSFGGWPLAREIDYPLMFVLLPLMGWVALRFTQLEATLTVALVSAMAVADTVKGVGPFARGDVNESLVLLQAFIGIIAVTILAMVAMVAEVQRAQQELRVRVRQQAAVASLGRAALADGGVEAFLRDAAIQVTQTLGNDMCGIFEALPDGDALGLMTAVGWPPGGEGREVIDAGPGTLAGLALHSDTPVIVAEFASETRFDGTGLPAVLGAVSGMTASIAGEGRAPFGLILTCAKSHRTFTEDDVTFLQAVAHLLAVTVRRKRTEKELARSNAELQQFAHAASHDLQEPLRTIASYTQLLQRRYGDRLDSDANEFIQFAVSGATRMRTLVQALLDYSRIGGSGRKVAPLRPERLLAQAMSNLAVRIAETEAAVTHDRMAPILGDEPLVVQLLQNLLANAIKFSGGRRPVIHLSTTRSGGEVIFSVKDNGIGIDPRHLETIFLIFRRLHAADEYPGTGVGLAICKKIVERHGGRIWAESAPGQGSTFHFTMPAAERGGA